MTSTNIFNGVLLVRRTDVKFRHGGETYIGKCTLADNLDNIVASNFDRCDSSAMPISITTNESANELEITFRVLECGVYAGFTSILLKKKPRKCIKKVLCDAIPAVEDIINVTDDTAQSAIIVDTSGGMRSIPSQCLDLVHNIAHYRAENDVQMILLQSLFHENAQLRDVINTNQSMISEYLNSINHPIALTQTSLSGDQKLVTDKKRLKLEARGMFSTSKSCRYS